MLERSAPGPDDCSKKKVSKQADKFKKLGIIGAMSDVNILFVASCGHYVRAIYLVNPRVRVTGARILWVLLCPFSGIKIMIRNKSLNNGC